MAYLAIAGPFAEHNFADERWLHPVCVPAEPSCWPGRKWTSGLLNRIEPPAEIERARGGKPRSNFPREHEPSLVVVVPGKQRTDALPRSFGVREAADDELLPQHALRLHPCIAASGLVVGVAALRDDPLELEAARLREHAATLPGDVLGVADAAARA